MKITSFTTDDQQNRVSISFQGGQPTTHISMILPVKIEGHQTQDEVKALGRKEAKKVLRQAIDALD